MTQINFNFKGVPDTSFFSLGNQWENKTKSIQFSLPAEVQNYNKYLVASYFDKTVTHILPINDNQFVITSTLTSKAGNWEMYVMAREDELVLDENVDISPIENKRIWLSNAIIGTVNANFSKSSIQLPSELDENFQILYDDLLTLKSRLSNIQDGFSPIVNVEEVENGHKVSIQDKNDTKEFVVLDGVNGKDGTNGADGKNGINGRDGIDGVTPNLTIGNVTTLSSDQEATATITGTKENPVLNLGLPKGKDGQSVSSDGVPIQTKDTYGEKLVAEYIHQGNQEIHFTEFDWETGIGTTSEPHGLTGSHRIIIVPNDWHTVGHKNLAYIPNEWLIYTSYIHVTYVSGNQLKVTGSDASTIITVNSSDPRQNIDITKFHLEIPIDWNITNLNISRSRRLKVIIQGYLRSITYRYMRVDGKFQDTPEDKTDNIFWTSNYLGIPKIIRIAPNTIHGLFAMIEHTFDMSLPLHCYFRQNTTVWGKRSWESSTYFSHDQNTETQIMYYNITKTIKMIDSIACSNGYGMISNYSVIRVYKMSEEPQDE